MAHQVELQFAAATDTGLIRAHNEDSIAISSARGLAILADGMGGYNAGEVASGIATAILKESLENGLENFPWNLGANRASYLQQLVVESIDHANIAIYETARNDPQYAGMGTTLVMALFHHDKITVAHVGDSRAYRLRHGTLELITRDHSLLQEQIDAGLIDPESARFSPNRNLVTRAVGVNYVVDVEIHDHLTEAGDVYLLCSDGLSDMLSTQEISEILTAMDADLETISDALVQRANDNGGRDNTSVILIKVQSNQTETKRLFRQILDWGK